MQGCFLTAGPCPARWVNLFTMANLSYSNNNNATAVAMAEIIKAAPLALLVCALLTFGAVAVFVHDYYRALFLPRFGPAGAAAMAGTLAAVQELIRFGLLVASIRDFSERRAAAGWLGLVGSLGLVFHDLHTAQAVASLWQASGGGVGGVLTYLVLVGLLLEVRLILTASRTVAAPAVAVNGQARPVASANGAGVL